MREHGVLPGPKIPLAAIGSYLAALVLAMLAGLPLIPASLVAFLVSVGVTAVSTVKGILDVIVEADPPRPVEPGPVTDAQVKPARRAQRMNAALEDHQALVDFAGKVLIPAAAVAVTVLAAIAL